MNIINKLEPNLILGINIFRNLNCIENSEVKDFIQDSIKLHLASHLKDLPVGFDFSRKLYRIFKIDPTKYRTSSEALYRRLKREDEFPWILPIVDLTNYLSFLFQLPFGLYDYNKMEGDITARLGDDLYYKGMGKNSVKLKGKIVLHDEIGPFGNPSSDSHRTSVNLQSKDIIQVIFFHGDYPEKQSVLKQSMETLSDYFEFADYNSFLV